MFRSLIVTLPFSMKKGRYWFWPSTVVPLPLIVSWAPLASEMMGMNEPTAIEPTLLSIVIECVPEPAALTWVIASRSDPGPESALVVTVRLRFVGGNACSHPADALLIKSPATKARKNSMRRPDIDAHPWLKSRQS
jgi:hypothetical protein